MMYKGPQLFDFIGSLIRWSYLKTFSNKYRNEKKLYRKITNYDPYQSIDNNRAINFFIGFLSILCLLLVIYFVEYKIR